MLAKKTVFDRLALSVALIYAAIWIALFLLPTLNPDEFGFCWIPVAYWSMPSARLIPMGLFPRTPFSFYEIVFGGICNCILIYVAIFVARKVAHAVRRALHNS